MKWPDGDLLGGCLLQGGHKQTLRASPQDKKKKKALRAGPQEKEALRARPQG